MMQVHLIKAWFLQMEHITWRKVRKQQGNLMWILFSICIRKVYNQIYIFLVLLFIFLGVRKSLTFQSFDQVFHYRYQKQIILHYMCDFIFYFQVHFRMPLTEIFSIFSTRLQQMLCLCFKDFSYLHFPFLEGTP